MTTPMFNLERLALLNRCRDTSEALVARHYSIPALPSGLYPYELATLADVSRSERAPGSMAHLVVYERPRRDGVEHLYRICLQDDVILRRAADGDGHWLAALLCYVVTHELVHVVRFQRGEQAVHLPHERRAEEERLVHALAVELLRSSGQPHWQQLAALWQGAPHAEKTTLVPGAALSPRRAGHHPRPSPGR